MNTRPTQKRTELDCPHPDCAAIIPVRFDPTDEYEGRYLCRCNATTLRLVVSDGTAKVSMAESQTQSGRGKG